MKAMMSRLLGNKKIYVLFLVLLQIFSDVKCSGNVEFSTHDLKLLVDNTHFFDVTVRGQFNTSLTLNFHEEHDGIIQVVPSSVNIPVEDSQNNSLVRSYQVCILGRSPGHVDILANVTPSGYIVDDNLFIRVTVEHSNVIDYISDIVGWIYFVAWSVSFYPQIYINYNRKSVVGLNFDFLSLNIVGFILYSLFNIGLYFIPELKEEYFGKHPHGLNPVQINDIFFSVHATIATLLTIVQCFIYERGNQSVSITARSILGLFAGVIIVSSVLASTFVITWLDFLYYCSYIKLAITLIKYVPQAFMNYKRKSTVGWSIGNIFLDFVGGMLSMLQMLLNAYNYNDWGSIFGDPTKFGLGLFSVIFDIFFIIQHYVLYRNLQPYVEIVNEENHNEPLTPNPINANIERD